MALIHYIPGRGWVTDAELDAEAALKESQVGTVSARGNTPETGPGTVGARLQDPNTLRAQLADTMRRRDEMQKAYDRFKEQAPRGENYTRLCREMEYALEMLEQQQGVLETAITYALLDEAHKLAEDSGAACSHGADWRLVEAPEPAVPEAPGLSCFTPSIVLTGVSIIMFIATAAHGFPWLLCLIVAAAALITFRVALKDNTEYQTRERRTALARQEHAVWEQDARLPPDVAEELRAWWWERQVQEAGADDGDLLALTAEAQAVLAHYPSTWLDVRTGRIEFHPAARVPEPRPPADPIPEPSVPHEIVRKFSAFDGLPEERQQDTMARSEHAAPPLPEPDLPLAIVVRFQAMAAGMAIMDRRESSLKRQARMVVLCACFVAVATQMIRPLLEHLVLR